MALLSSQLFLYNFTLQKSGAIHQCICGNFSEAKAQEIIVSRGKTLELLRPSETTGSLDTIISTEVFGIIRSLIPFRLAGMLLNMSVTTDMSRNYQRLYHHWL